MVLGGDVMVARGIAEIQSQNPAYAPFEGITPLLQSANLAAANLESPFGTKFSFSMDTESGVYNLCAAPEGVEIIQNTFHLFSTANNHEMDCGDFNQTMTMLEQAGVTPLTGSFQPVWISVKGQQLAFFAFDDVKTSIDLPGAQFAVRVARRLTPYVIVSIHWGQEYHPGQNSRQIEIGQGLADAGALVIWGHHPHVLQPLNIIQGAEQRNPTLIAYSLGNLLFDQVTPPGARLSTLLEINLSQQRVQNIALHPLEIDPFSGIIFPADSENSQWIRHRLLEYFPALYPSFVR